MHFVLEPRRSLPIASESVESVVCADVIEHIEKPEVALNEIHRILKKDGKAVLVVPSLYKLDALKVPHIMQKRYSSHENRLSTKEWVDLIKDAGFGVDTKLTQPLAIASGLLYLTWLNPDYVPEKQGENSKECYSDNALRFKVVKSAVGKVDGQIDDLILNDQKVLDRITEKFEQGTVKDVLGEVGDLYSKTNGTEKAVVDGFIRNFDDSLISQSCHDLLTETVEESNLKIDDNAFIGNSALLVLNKS